MIKVKKILLVIIVTFIAYVLVLSIPKSDNLKVIPLQYRKIEVLSDIPDYTKTSSIPRKQKKSYIVENLQKQYNNTDIVGRVQIPGTSINEVVSQTNDNKHYLKHDSYNNYDIMGSTFLDYRVRFNEGRKNLIFSHNSNTSVTPFHELEKYYTEEFYRKNKYIYLEDDYGVSKYEIFSIFIEYSDWSYMNIYFNDNLSWLNHINGLKDKSWYTSNIELNENDQILILQTCSFHKSYSEYKDKYLLVISKKVE